MNGALEGQRVSVLSSSLGSTMCATEKEDWGILDGNGAVLGGGGNVLGGGGNVLGDVLGGGGNTVLDLVCLTCTLSYIRRSWSVSFSSFSVVFCRARIMASVFLSRPSCWSTWIRSRN
jgi:hypothetical protein